MADIFDEVSKELKQERITSVLTKYTPHTIFLLVLIIVATSVAVVWKSHVVTKQREQGDIYNKMLFTLNSESDEKTANESIDHLIKAGSGGYQTLASFKKCKVLIKSGEYDEAIKLYDEINKDSSYDKALRDLAAVLAASVIIEQKKDNDIQNRLNQITSKDNVFRASGCLLKINYLLQNGNKEEALKLAREVSSDETVIIGIRNKADAIIATTLEQ